MRKTLHLLFILLLVFQGAAKAQDRIYWGVNGSTANISSARLDGTDIQKSVSLTTTQGYDMETDFYKKILYFGDGAFVKKCNLDGSGMQTIYTATPGYIIGGLALDLINNKLYYSQFQQGVGAITIFRSNLDGTGIEPIITSTTGQTYNLVVSNSLQKLYWTVSIGNASTVYRSNLDGTGVEQLTTLPTFVPGICIDEENQKLYLAYWQNNEVRSTDMTCSTAPTLIFSSSNGTFQMAVSNVENKLYFAEMNTKKIRRCNLDGSSPQDIVTLPAGQIMALSIPTIPPAPTINANETYTFELNDFIFSSVNKDLLTKIKITTLTSKGTIYLDANNNNIVDAGEEVMLNQEIPKADLVAGKLKFNPVTNEYGAPYTTFTFNWFDGTSYSTLDYLQYIYVLSVAPTVTTQAVSDIGSTTATGNGNITNLGVPFPTSYGICWNTAGSPTTSNSKVDLGATSATGAFTAAITGLAANTTYKARAYAVNEAGTSYGAEVSFTTGLASQTISFGALDNKTYGDASYSLSATSTSGLPISYSSDNTAVARVLGSTVFILGAGTANITASQAGNATYTAATNVTQQLTVSKKALTVTAATDTKTYDGTTASTLVPTVGTLVTGDAINVAPTQVFDNASVGTTHVLTASGLTIKRSTIDYAPAFDKASGETIYKTHSPDVDVTGNYEISYAPATGTINKKAVTVTATADTKYYDGTTFSVNRPVVGTLVTGDEINTTPTQVFDNASVGPQHILTASGLTIKNGTADATGNYDISYVSATGTIDKLPIKVRALTDTKTYDGTTASTAVPTIESVSMRTIAATPVSKVLSTTDPLASGDAINTAPTQTFDNASVGTTHVLTASGLTIKNGASDATGNYDISYVTATGTISVKPLTISAPTVTLRKVDDGNAAAAVTIGTLSGVLPGDAGNVTVTASASYDNAAIGTNKTITVVYTLNGNAAGNYSAPANYVTSGEIYAGTIALQPLSNPTPSTTGTDLVLSYNVVTGGPTQYQITFETRALAVGIQNVSYTALVTTGTTGSITIPVPEGTRPGHYKGSLQMKNDFGVESTVYNFVLTVNIPTEYIAVKYNRVLVLDNSTRIFKAYQWFKDGVAIEGATKQFYRDPKGLVGTYSMQATDIDGEIVYSFPKVLNIPLALKVTAYPTMVKANQTCTVEITDEAMKLDLAGAELSVYSSQGIRVYHSTKVESLNAIKLPIMDGVYSGRLTTADGQSFLFKVIVAN